MSLRSDAEKRLTDASVRLRRTGGELEHVGAFVPQTPAVKDLTVTLLKVVKLQHVGRVQQPDKQTNKQTET